jgi:rhomboid protease GluP
MRARTGSTLCPSCGQLVGVNDAQCLGCGRRNPGMWGFGSALRGLGRDMGFLPLVFWGCGAAYLATLASDPGGIEMGGLSFGSPSIQSLFLFGASGSIPVFQVGRWWTVLSASWLHAGILHIAFNMLWVRRLAPDTAAVYGAGRAIIIYVVGGALGFVASSAAGHYLPFLPGPLHGAGFTVGASAPLFALLGALLHYGHRSGSGHVAEQVKGMAVGMLIFGFLMPGVDNWAHLGGFAGGYAMAKWLDPLVPERGDHVVAALVCLALSVAAVVYSVATGLQFFR